ncbi:MAG: M48 family metalloprotease [Methylibium sp.]|uniref:M48 family metalloprotease n=1 Tax=Methylibium sp. TaxID=2067992 RepID=UPI001857BAEB|nr:M48 family metalloprotease [Methylibium sp.]MBA3598336.1 M48 family metalloprotease [Methylibium sp.]
MRSLLFPLLLTAALLAGCATVVNPVTGKEERTVMDVKTEIAEGRKAHQAVIAEYGIYPDARLQTYVKGIGQKLAAQSHRSELEWTFTVLDSPEINAFALPGGYVYVTRGIMAYMESEADLAGVIGHEIGHVTARHGAQRATRQQTAGLGVLAASVLGAVFGVGDVASQLSQGVAAGYVANYSRDQELQADKLGAEYLVRNDYDPQNMVDVINVLRNQERFAAEQARAEGKTPKQGPDWLASHPSNEQRLEDIEQIAAGYDRKAKYVDDGRARYLKAIDGLPFGESREQGVTRGRNFYHEPLGIALTAPQGWRIQNSQDAITLINSAGDAGLIVQLAPTKAGNTHEEIIKNALKPTQGRVEKDDINGLPATHFVGTRRNPQGQAQNVVATVVTGPERNNFVLLHAARDAAARQRAAAALREAENSFRPLTAADRKAAAPWSLRTVAFPRGGFAELARRSPLMTNPEQQLKLINGVYGGGPQPEPGQPVKVIQ